MGYIICLIVVAISTIALKFIFGIDFKQLKQLENNEELNKITDKFPTNIKLAKEILEMTHDKSSIPTIEEAKDTKTSLYIAITNKIIIADMQNNYARLQTIAHECIHSCQSKNLLLFNFAISNINILYFISLLILSIFKIIRPDMFQVFIIMFLGLIQFAVRSFLEIDAMTKARFLTEKYIDEKNLINEEDKQKLLDQYDLINQLGIPFVVYNIFIDIIWKPIIYLILCVIV